HAFRRELFAHAARRHHLPLLYCNRLGANEELVFAGGVCAFDAQGNLLGRRRVFGEDLLIVGIPGRPGSRPRSDAAIEVNRIERTKEGVESIYHALVLGLRDYCHKCRFKSIVLGLSGGIDSAVTAALAAAAVGQENVTGVAMPSRFSSEHSV